MLAIRTLRTRLTVGATAVALVFAASAAVAAPLGLAGPPQPRTGKTDRIVTVANDDAARAEAARRQAEAQRQQADRAHIESQRRQGEMQRQQAQQGQQRAAADRARMEAQRRQAEERARQQRQR